MSERIEKCRACKFWEVYPGLQTLPDGSKMRQVQGKCHYDYPKHAGGYNGWPQTNEWDWCGQWQPNKNDHAAVFADYLEEQGEPTAAEKLRKFNQQ